MKREFSAIIAALALALFSAQTHSFDYRLRKRRINQLVFRLLAKGLSQRGSAQVLGVNPKTIARRVIRFGDCAKKHLARHNFLESKMLGNRF